MNLVGRDETRWRRVGMTAGGLGVAGAAVIAAFIASEGGRPGPPEPERAIAIPALFAATGVIAALAAHQARHVLVGAAGLLFIAGSIISPATYGFLLLGVVLLACAVQTGPAATRRRRMLPDPLVASAVAALVIVAAVGLLGTTDERCSVGFGDPADPAWETVPCDQAPTSVGGPGGPIATSFDSGAISGRGLLIEAVALAGAVALVLVPIRARTAGTDA